MIYSKEVENMCTVAKGPKHGPAPIPEEGKWVKSYDIKDISGLSHGIGWCAPQQGACKLTLNVKDGIVEEALVETIGCSGMTHSAAMAAEILPNKTLLECLNTDLVCDAINTAMKNITAEARQLSQRAVFQSAQVWRISVRVFAARLVQCTAQTLRAFVTWKWLKAMFSRQHLTRTMKLSAISS